MIEELSRELAVAGIRGRRRARILAELTDHLACDPSAELGDPHALAVEFADELAVSGARRSALFSFGALALVGLGLIATQAAVPTYPDIFGGHSPAFGVIAVLCILVASQVAFVAGSLALLRGLRLRGEAVLSAAEVGLLRRRTAVALAAGAVTVAGMGLDAYNSSGLMPAWWTTMAAAAAAAGALAIGGVALNRGRTSAVSVSIAGDAGGFDADLGPFARPAAIGALVIAGALLAGMMAEQSLLEGAERAAAEGIFFFAGLLLLGRFLGIRHGVQPVSDR